MLQQRQQYITAVCTLYMVTRVPCRFSFEQELYACVRRAPYSRMVEGDVGCPAMSDLESPNTMINCAILKELVGNVGAIMLLIGAMSNAPVCSVIV